MGILSGLLLALLAILSLPAMADDYIEGRVVSAEGHAEAGVWVIAETASLPTGYRKIVVTDDDGRFVVPDLPAGDHQLWARGYGIRDSGRVSAKPGTPVELSVSKATGTDAAAIYPASYWLSMVQPPVDHPGWINYFKLGCQLCHQVGSAFTRTRTREMFDQGLRKATYMHVTADGLDRELLLDTLEDWSERISTGETPPMPPRPAGIERNLVITQWEWGDAYTYAHDEIATDKRDPSLYANGPIYGVDLANDRLLVVDPVRHTAATHKVPTLDGFSTPWCEQTYQGEMLGTGDAVIPMGFGSLGCPVEPGITPFEGRYDNPANPHNPMLDDQGRVWITTQVRRQWDVDLPQFCRDAPGIRGRYHHRQLGYFDTADSSFQLIDTCYGTHHLQFDEDGVLWTSGDSFVIGWFDPAKYDPEKPGTLEAAQGWVETIVDSDGDAVPDLTLVGFNYGIIPNPVDGSIWTAQPGGNPGEDLDYRGRLIRYDPATGSVETYSPPAPGAGPRGVDVDGNGIIWASMGGSGHLARFDRSKCRQYWGAGDQCPEGWTLYRSPGPMMKTPDGRDTELGADFHYYLFVDRFNTLGLGENAVVLNGTGSDSLLAFDQDTEAFTVIRIPYPLNTFTRGLDGRIDDVDAGWKGRGLWFTNGGDPIHHSEVPKSFVGKVQLRPNPLAH